MISQKQAVKNAVLSIFPNYELGGETVLSSLLNSDNKKEIKQMVFEAFKAGEVSFSAEAQAKYGSDDAKLLKYVGGMVDNWVRKDPEFNNGQKYITKNPGSRAGSSDDQIKALRALKKTTTDTTVLAEIDEAISTRLAEIKPTKTVEINVEALPEHLKHLAPSNS